MLGVRQTTCNDLCYLELDIPPVKAIVTRKQRLFVQRLNRERRGQHEDPWLHAVSLILGARHATSRYLHDLLTVNVDDERAALAQLKETVEMSDSSRRIKYVVMNLRMTKHPVYCQRSASPSQELHRQAFTRLRVSAHSLAIETGRWNRGGRGRLPVEQRLCECGEVQDEIHVVEVCPRTEDIRKEYGYTTYQELIIEDTNFPTMEIIFIILSSYQ